MTVEKLREILSYYPADAEVRIKDRYGDPTETKDFKIISVIKDEAVTDILLWFNWQ